MFTNLVSAAFSFLEDEFRFIPKIIHDREVQYERADVFVNISHSLLDEVSLRIGISKGDNQRSFDAGILLALSNPEYRRSVTDPIASAPAQIEKALLHSAQLLRTHGTRLLDGDLQVFDEMQKLSERHQDAKRENLIRQRACSAFAAKNFGEAIRHYRMLGEQRNPLDTKRMEIAENRLGRQ